MEQACPRKVNRTKRFALMVATFAIGVTAGYLAWRSAQVPNLLDRSHVVADISSWGGGRRFNVSIGYHWLSDHELLMDRYVGDVRTIFRHSIVDDHEEKLSELTKAFKDFGGETMDEQNVSPDGKWFIRSDRWGKCLQAEVNGKQKYIVDEFDGDTYRNVFWTGDSRYWLEQFRLNDDVRCIRLHDVTSSKASQDLSIGWRVAPLKDLCGLITPNKAISVSLPNWDDDQHSGTQKVVISQFSITDNEIPTTSEAHFPAGMFVHRAYLSTRGDQILWEVRYVRSTSWFSMLIGKITGRMSKSPVRGSGFISYWISDLKGKGVRELARLHVRNMVVGYDEGWIEGSPRSLKWLPTGTAVSFELDGKLYVMNVD
jgi:hypothetical protein